MSLEKLKEVIGEDFYKQIAPKLEGKDLFFAEGKDYVPKARLDEVINTKKELEAQIVSRDSQLTELQKAAEGNEELTTKITALQEENTKSKESYEAKILQLQKDYALESALTKSGARNPKALKGMLDLEKCEFKDGAYKGLDEQIASVKKENDWLFNSGTSKGGFNHNEGNPNPGNDEFAQFRNLNF